MTENYIITFRNHDGNLVFKFVAETGKLAAIEFNFDYTDAQLAHLRAHLPSNLQELQGLVKLTKNWFIERMPLDLEFKTFWAKYNHKVGNKSRAERIWKALNEANRAKAMNFLTKYDAQLVATPHAKLYPETYLHQQRWNN